MKLNFFILSLFISFTIPAQDFVSQDLIINNFIEGTLLIPNNNTKTVAIIIPGSGPTDRDGNQNFVKNNSLKYLAEDITKQGIATFRYDKRVLTLLKKGAIDEKKIRFDDFVTDAKNVINYLKTRRRYEKIFVIGHSQGSLVGMLASHENVNGFVSLSGPGKSIDQTIIDQLNNMNVPELVKSAEKTLAIMKTGKIDKDFNPTLANMFHLGVQPFMISWIKYNPKEEISKLEIPTLIINGTNDVQITIEEANLLKEGKKNAEFILIEHMNHVLKKVDSKDQQENLKTYNQPELRNTPELANHIITFIKKKINLKHIF